jgi:hypothetical protein
MPPHPSREPGGPLQPFASAVLAAAPTPDAGPEPAANPTGRRRWRDRHSWFFAGRRPIVRPGPQRPLAHRPWAPPGWPSPWPAPRALRPCGRSRSNPSHDPCRPGVAGAQCRRRSAARQSGGNTRRSRRRPPSHAYRTTRPAPCHRPRPHHSQPQSPACSIAGVKGPWGPEVASRRGRNRNWTTCPLAPAPACGHQIADPIPRRNAHVRHGAHPLVHCCRRQTRQTPRTVRAPCRCRLHCVHRVD